MKKISAKVKDWVGKRIHWNFGDTAKWYMQKQESVLENRMHKILCDFGIQTD